MKQDGNGILAMLMPGLTGVSVVYLLGGRSEIISTKSFNTLLSY